MATPSDRSRESSDGRTGLGYLIVIATQRAQLGLVYGTVFALIGFAVVFYNVVAVLIDYVTPGRRE